MLKKSLGDVTEVLLKQIEEAEKILIGRAEKLENVEEHDKKYLQENKKKSENIDAIMKTINSDDWICPVANTVKFYDSWNEKRPRGIHRGVDIVVSLIHI